MPNKLKPPTLPNGFLYIRRSLRSIHIEQYRIVRAALLYRATIKRINIHLENNML